MADVLLSRLTKTYTDSSARAVTAVKGIDLTIADGEFMVLVGPSGCGKSTTLRMIAGLEEISGGTVSIDGRVVNEVAPKDRDIAMVFQNYALYPHMSVRENLAFGLTLRKFPKEEIARRVQDAATLLGLTDYLERKPKALSGGQRQRVAVGRAIVRHPKVFLFDEPLSNLDAKMRGAMRTEIAKLHARLKATMIYVTHDQIEAMTMGDRICVMQDGEIRQVATPLELYNQPANLFVAGFIGSPPMNFLHGTVQSIEGRTTFIEQSAAGGAPVKLLLDPHLTTAAAAHRDKPVVLGLRPEDLSLATPANDGPTINAEVELAEAMGAETLLHVKTAAQTALIARIPPTALFTPGQRVALAPNLARAHLFAAETGQALT